MKNVNYFNIRYGGMRSRLREQIGRSRPGVRELGNKVEDARRGRRKSRWNLERGARAMVSFTLCFRGTVRLVAPCWRRDWSPRLFRGRGPCGGGGLERWSCVTVRRSLVGRSTYVGYSFVPGPPPLGLFASTLSPIYATLSWLMLRPTETRQYTTRFYEASTVIVRARSA